MKDIQNAERNLFTQNRRNFIKNICVASGAVTLTPLLSQCEWEHQSELYKHFKNPSAEAKPFFRWWWNGNKLSKKEISRELKLMHEAGIGGIEINPIAMPEQVENPVDEYIGAGIVAVEWAQYLGPDYFALPTAVAVCIEAAADGGRRISVRSELPYIVL